MYRIVVALVAATSCVAIAQAQEVGTESRQISGPLLTLDEAVALAGGSAPAAEAAAADVDAASAARRVAGLRPNPALSVEVENFVGTGPYNGVNGADITASVAIPLELGGKRQARIAVADAAAHRAQIAQAIAQADIRFQVTELYIQASAAEVRVAIAEDQYRIAGDTARAATIRVQAGRASPLEQERAEVARLTAETEAEKARRLADAARASLARRIGRPVTGPLDVAVLGGPGSGTMGPPRPVSAAGTLALAAADADLATADAGVELARSQRVPDLTVGPGVRRLEATNDVAAVFSVSVPLPLFNNGRAAVDQANAERRRADAQRRVTALDIEQKISDAEVEAANAAAAARVASGPALSSAMEAARIARIGYREGKFGQLELLDAERTLTEMRSASIEALASYQLAKARLERLTAPAPLEGN
ncbi:MULTISPECIES: TolC family protein [Sphingopyxis]|jgi:cobalt-zinc-cadmium efflux system outer membrane protein|uniref:Outer membrane efflux protein n=2 Tax=Sphingopyxis TaxID=165697 RepID=Q1GQB8_SPHAL|nr:MULTISPECIES: TolC family protein [Sphingopyxis]MBD3734114.1 TolC family protein [Sphingopyxis sp.]ABF54154.1 outer membrane efflux protein [Sphingopyxis alaskensis RB2256]KTE26989.1 transporter [Sphingopyxis sp. H057]KTE54295.1 transporter [Sphingopyxis sp. H073]KTE56616.1 transporter [Sphingopyxis sp. H071]